MDVVNPKSFNIDTSREIIFLTASFSNQDSLCMSITRIHFFKLNFKYQVFLLWLPATQDDIINKIV